MLILPGPIKVDLLFDRRHEPEAPWQVSAEALEAVDYHFWDWILWIAGKHSTGERELVQQEFAKMSSHLLRPMGIETIPDTIETAIALYTAARRELENRLTTTVSEHLEYEIRRALRKSGYCV